MNPIDKLRVFFKRSSITEIELAYRAGFTDIQNLRRFLGIYAERNKSARSILETTQRIMEVLGCDPREVFGYAVEARDPAIPGDHEGVAEDSGEFIGPGHCAGDSTNGTR